MSDLGDIIVGQRARIAALEAERDHASAYADKMRAARDALEVQNEHLVQQNSEAVLLVAQLRARNGRLRKAVNWLRGAAHDEHKRFNFGTSLWETPDECMVWECQRSRDILAEAKDDE